VSLTDGFGFCLQRSESGRLELVQSNAINALGFCCFASGALEVALSTPLLSSPGHREIIRWLGIIAVVVASTVQMQDIGNQEGDRMRGRKSLPLTVGDGPARWMIAVPMVF
jgi:4-hydroxybenzoate polyprenyltransferase